LQLSVGEALLTEAHADSGVTRASPVSATELELFGFVVETGIDLGFVFGEKADGAAGFGDGPDGLGGVEEADVEDVAFGWNDAAGNAAIGDGRVVEGDDGGVDPGALALEADEVTFGEVEIALGFVVELGFELMALMVVVESFDGLLQGDGDEEADADGGDVDEEVAPGVDGFVGWVDV